MPLVSLYPENEFNGNPRNYNIDPPKSINTMILYNNMEQPLLVRSVLNLMKDYVVYLYHKSYLSAFGGSYIIVEQSLVSIDDVKKNGNNRVQPLFNGIALVHIYNMEYFSRFNTLYSNNHVYFTYTNSINMTQSFYYKETTNLISDESSDKQSDVIIDDSSNNDRPYVIDLSNAQLSTDSRDDISSGQVVTTLQPAPFQISPSGINECYKFYNEQKDKIKKLDEERTDLNFQVLKCTVDLQTLKRQIYDRYQNEVEVLKEKKRQLKEQYEKRKSIMDTFTYSDTEKVFLFIAILIDFVLIVVNVMLYKEY